MVLLTTLKTIAAKVEATIGTPESLTAADGVFNAQNPIIQSTMTVQEVEDPKSMNRQKGAAGARGGTMNFRTFMQWDGSATIPPWAEVLFPACGYVKTGTVFAPKSEGPGDNVKTLTMGVWTGDEGDWLFKSLAGAAGNFTFELISGEVAAIDWEFMGVFQPVIDAAVIAPTYPSANYFRFAGGDTTWGGVAKCIQQASVNGGNNVILRECASKLEGYESGLITDRRPMINMNPEATLVATDDIYGDWVGNTEAALAITLNNPDNNATIQIDAPAAQINNSQEGDRNGIAIDDIEFACNKNGTTQDEELKITFTAST